MAKKQKGKIAEAVREQINAPKPMPFYPQPKMSNKAVIKQVVRSTQGK